MNPFRRPYECWNINESDFPKQESLMRKLEFLIKYAILAPSSHNTQPWLFKVGKRSIEIFPDIKRSLYYSDRCLRELYISLGCALENLKVASTHYGLSFTVELLPEDDLGNCVVRVMFGKGQETLRNEKNEALFYEITKRVTNRSPHIPGREVDSRKIYSLATKMYQDIAVTFIHERSKMSEIAKILHDATLFAFSDVTFREELSDWVRPHYSSKPDGIPLFDIPAVLALFAPYLVRNGPPKYQASQAGSLMEGSNCILVVSAPEDDKEHWLQAGAVFESLSLSASTQAISVSPMAAVIEHEESSLKLKKILKMKNKPLVFARVGYASKPTSHSPRRDAWEVIL